MVVGGVRSLCKVYLLRDYGLVVEVEGGAGFSLEKAHMKFSVSCRTLNRTIYNHKELQFFRFQGSLREKPEHQQHQSCMRFCCIVLTVEARKLEHRYPHGPKVKYRRSQH